MDNADSQPDDQPANLPEFYLEGLGMEPPEDTAEAASASRSEPGASDQPSEQSEPVQEPEAATQAASDPTSQEAVTQSATQPGEPYDILDNGSDCCVDSDPGVGSLGEGVKVEGQGADQRYVIGNPAPKDGETSDQYDARMAGSHQKDATGRLPSEPQETPAHELPISELYRPANRNDDILPPPAPPLPTPEAAEHPETNSKASTRSEPSNEKATSHDNIQPARSPKPPLNVRPSITETPRKANGKAYGKTNGETHGHAHGSGGTLVKDVDGPLVAHPTQDRDICGRRCIRCKDCRRKFKREEHGIWVCPSCGANRTCLGRVAAGLPAGSPCAQHGGKNPVAGPTHHRYQHGRYSKVTPPHMTEAYEASRKDDELLSTREEIALHNAMIVERWGRLQKLDASGKLWDRLKKLQLELEEARSMGDTAMMAKLLQRQSKIIKEGAEYGQIMREVSDLCERKSKLSSREFMRLKEMRQMLSQERATAIIVSLAASVREHVTDQEVLARISQDFSLLLDDDTGTSAGVKKQAKLPAPPVVIDEVT